MKKITCPYAGNTYDVYAFNGYEFISTLARDQAQALLDAVLQQAYTTNKVYNDDSSSFVANINAGRLSTIILKIPRERNNRAWERFLTFFRPNEAFRTFFSMMVVQSIGLRCPQPLIAVHKRERGVSVDSFFVYEFIDGLPAATKDLPKLIQAMKSLHQAGYVRSDPKLSNFIIANDEVVLIDFRLKRPRFFPRFQFALNLCRFLHLAVSEERNELERYFEGDRLLRVAHPLLLLKTKTRQLRRSVKRAFRKTASR